MNIGVDTINVISSNSSFPSLERLRSFKYAVGAFGIKVFNCFQVFSSDLKPLRNFAYTPTKILIDSFLCFQVTGLFFRRRNNFRSQSEDFRKINTFHLIESKSFDNAH